MGPREGHMTRLAARAAGAGKGVGGEGRGERRGQSRAVDCGALRFASALAAARLSAVTPPPRSASGWRRTCVPGGVWCGGGSRGLGMRDLGSKPRLLR